MPRITRMFVLIMIGAFCLWSLPVTQVQAVVGEQTITGLPPNTVVSIKLPDGTTVEGEETKTDDDGKLVYLFPKGKSTITWDGGSKVVNAGWSTAKTGGVAAGSVLGAAALVAAADSDSNNNPGTGAVRALSVSADTAMQLGISAGDTIPLTCITGTPDVVPAFLPDCACEHVHDMMGSIIVAVLGSSASEPMPASLLCGHGCVIVISNPTHPCP